MRTISVISHAFAFVFLFETFCGAGQEDPPASVYLAYPGARTAGSLRLPSLPVRIELPRVANRCFDSASGGVFTPRLPSQVATSGTFVLSPEALAVLRLDVDTLPGDSRCRLGVLLSSDVESLERHLLLEPSERADDVGPWDRLLSAFSADYLVRHAARLSVTTVPAGVHASLDGIDMGMTPFFLEQLRPGTAILHVSGYGWNAVTDTLSLEAGVQVRRSYPLTRSQAWLDSVRRVEVERHRDSVWGAARQNPSQALPELFARLGRIPFPAGRQSVAVVPFQVTGQVSGYNPGVMAAEYGVASFSKDPRFTVVERDGLNRLLKEQALALSGAVSDSGAAVAGRLVAARYLVTGTVTVSGRVQTFAARLVDVETGEIVSAAVATVGSDGLEELYRTALGERGQLSGSLYRSAAGPGWGQFYTGHPVHGGVFLTAALASLGFVGWSYADFLSKDDDYKKYRNHDASTVTVGAGSDAWVAAAEHARTKRNDAATQINISLAVLGGVWVANLVDAGILGYQESRRIKAEYFAWAPTGVDVRPQGVQLSWRF